MVKALPTQDEIQKVIENVLTSLEQPELNTQSIKIYRELQNLSHYITDAKNEIAQIRPHDIQNVFIPAATDELDAVVNDTEQATGTILDSAEAIMDLASKLPPEDQDRQIHLTTQIFEACNFQDVTGQRITKVIKAFKHIEQTVQSLLATLGDEIACNLKPDALINPIPNDKDLMNGPQLPKNAMDQSNIDELMAG